MNDLFEYLKWRGDIPFSQVPPTPVDAVIFCELVYIRFDGIVSNDLAHPVFLKDAAKAFLEKPEQERESRIRLDEKLLAAAAESVRFGTTGLALFRDIHIPEEETQFAAMAFLLDDGSAFLAFRGTDYTLTGWKEDFNMSFQDSIPAQREALAYTQSFTEVWPVILRLGGHSKGGNIAVYAAAKSTPEVQQRILAVYNNDGPGFTEALMGDPGYLAMVPRIKTYIPQSSIIGMLLEHEEPYTVVKSSLSGILQHDIYSWEVAGGDFVHVEEVTQESRFIDGTIKRWVADMDREERSKLVDKFFGLLGAGGKDQLIDLLHPTSIAASVKQLTSDESLRDLLSDTFRELRQAAVETRKEMKEEQNGCESNDLVLQSKENSQE